MVKTEERYAISPYTKVAWLQGRDAVATCPACGFEGKVEQVLEVDYQAPRESLFYHLQRCPHCNLLFSDTPPNYNYHDDELVIVGWPSYYVQMGVGLWEIAAAICRVEKPAAAKALEIGSAYGFGLDFCVRGRGWQGVGYDPSPLAGIGAKALGLHVVQGLFDEATLADGPWDVVIATELIEHLETPHAFLQLMRRAVAEDGVLVLTTPAAEKIGPHLSTWMFEALLVPNRHVMLHSRESLAEALRQAGFTHVEVKQKDFSLIAYASPSPLRLDEDQKAAWRTYQHYMRTRAEHVSVGSDLHLCFAGRAFFEAVNGADYEHAQILWAGLNAGTQARFGYHLETLSELPDHIAVGDLPALGSKIPYGLGMILFARAMWLLAQGQGRQEVKPVLVLALAAVEALQTVLREQGLGQDILSASIGAVLQAEILLCDAQAGLPTVVDELLALGNEQVSWRGFVSLVNAGAYEAAAKLRAGLVALPDDENLRRDVRLTSLSLDLSPAGEITRIPEHMEALQGDEASRDSCLSAFVTLVNAQAFAQAEAVLPQTEAWLQTCVAPYQPVERDVLFAMGILFLQSDRRLVRSTICFARLREEMVLQQPAGRAPLALFWPALRGEILALHKLKRGDEAQDLLSLYLATYPSAPEDLQKALKQGE